MNIITRIVFFIIIVFILNIILYYISEDYRFFIKKIKNTNEIVYTEKASINDKIDYNNLNRKNKEYKTKIENNTIKEDINKEKLKKQKIENKQNNKIQQKVKNTNIYKEVILGKNYKDILSLFSEYKLKKIELQTKLFDLTDEYPDNYYEYYSPQLTLYLFTTKSYEDVKDILKVISYNIPYKINEVNNLGDKSFYINLDDKIKDNNVRIVISIKNITFGLKIKKNLYNNIKSILQKSKGEIVNTKK